jgi:endonuclease YncB( thermonuclease family)
MNIHKSVIDGRSFTIRSEARGLLHVVLYGVALPTSAKALLKAKHDLTKASEGHAIHCSPINRITDQDAPIECLVGSTPLRKPHGKENTRDLSARQLVLGNVTRTHPLHRRVRGQYKKAEAYAKKHKLGLWA